MASEMTYTRCEICHGGVGKTLCPCHNGTYPGWTPTGVTTAQLERLVFTDRVLAGDPGVDPVLAKKLGGLVNVGTRL